MWWKFSIQGGRNFGDLEEKCERVLPPMIYSLDESSVQIFFFSRNGQTELVHSNGSIFWLQNLAKNQIFFLKNAMNF